MALTASLQGSDYAGFLPMGLCSIYYQLGGEKILIILDLEEGLEWFRSAKSAAAETEDEKLKILQQPPCLQARAQTVFNKVPSLALPPGRHDFCGGSGSACRRSHSRRVCAKLARDRAASRRCGFLPMLLLGCGALDSLQQCGGQSQRNVRELKMPWFVQTLQNDLFWEPCAA